MYDWSELAYLLIKNGAIGAVAVALVNQTGQGIREWLRGRAEVAKIKAAVDADVTRIQATTRAKIAEMSAAHGLERERGRDRRQLDRRSRRLGDLSQLQAERDLGDLRDPGAARG